MKTSLHFFCISFALGWSAGALAQPVLSIDINERGQDPAGTTFAGFDAFFIDSVGSSTVIQTAPTVRTFGALTVTMSGVGATTGYDDRIRATPVNSGAFSQSLLLRDFVFSRDLGDGGLDVSVTGLTADRAYRVTIWSFDSSSGGTRVSDWIANGMLVREDYTFDGRVLPTSDDSYKFSFDATADNTGALLIQGRRDATSVDAAGAVSFGVFLNALQIVATQIVPVITIQPTGGTRGLGDRITFAVTAEGPPPLTYTWYKDGTTVVGTDSPTLALSDLRVEDSGTYSVHVQNSDGTAISSNAVLTVLPDPLPNVPAGLISYWPLNAVNVDEMSVASTPDLYSRNDMTLVNMGPLNQTPGMFGDALIFDGGTQHGFRSGGLPISPSAAFTVSLWVRASGVGQSDRRFFSESSTVANNPLFNLGTHASGADATIRVFIRNDAGTVLLSQNSTRGPLDGDWHHVVWTETNGQARLYIDGALDESNFNYTRSPLTLNQTSIGAIMRAAVSHWIAGGIDEVTLWNRMLTFTEVQIVRTNGVPPPVTALPPVLTRQPADADVFAGETVSLSVDFTGTQPLHFQWQRDGADVEDATNSVLLLASIQTNQAGIYSVTVTNEAGSTTSSNATVVVHPVDNVTSGLTAYWPLDTLTDLAPDTTTNGNHLFLRNVDSSNGVPGQRDNAVSFNGADELLARVNTNGFGLPIYHQRRYTVAMWVNGGANQTDRRVFSEGSTTNNNPLLNIGTDNAGASGAVDIFIRNDDGGNPVAHRKSAGIAFDGTWHHLAWVDSEGTAQLYIDGVLDTANFNYLRGNLTLDTASVGGILRGVPGNYFAGMIDDVAVWRRALSPSEILYVRDYGAVPPPPLRIAAIDIDDTTVTLTFTVPDPLTFYCIRESADITTPSAMWTEVAGVTFTPNGTTYTAQFPRPPGNQRFYRILHCP